MCFILVLGVFSFGFVLQNFAIPSGSMENTLLVGDHVLADRVTLSPQTRWAPFVHYRPVQHGDVIVFLKPHPEYPDFILVKRAIGLPGDHLRLERGVLYLNGVAQKEPYALGPRDDGQAQHAYEAFRDDFPSVAPSAEEQLTAVWREDLPGHVQNGDLVVPPGKVFAMGDNRTESLDSRFWGFVPEENIMGRPLVVFWSIKVPAENEEEQRSIAQRVGSFVQEMAHMFTQSRWRRTFHVVR